MTGAAVGNVGTGPYESGIVAIMFPESDRGNVNLKQTGPLRSQRVFQAYRAVGSDEALGTIADPSDAV